MRSYKDVIDTGLGHPLEESGVDLPRAVDDGKQKCIAEQEDDMQVNHFEPKLQQRLTSAVTITAVTTTSVSHLRSIWPERIPISRTQGTRSYLCIRRPERVQISTTQETVLISMSKRIISSRRSSHRPGSLRSRTGNMSSTRSSHRPCCLRPGTRQTSSTIV